MGEVGRIEKWVEREDDKEDGQGVEMEEEKMRRGRQWGGGEGNREEEKKEKEQTHRCISGTAVCPHPALERHQRPLTRRAAESPAPSGCRDLSGGRSSRGWSEAPGPHWSHCLPPGDSEIPRWQLEDEQKRNHT